MHYFERTTRMSTTAPIYPAIFPWREWIGSVIISDQKTTEGRLSSEMESSKAVVAILLLSAVQVFGQFTQITSPNSTYTGGTTVIPIVGADGSSVGSVSDGTQTLTFSSNLDVHTVPGGGWSTWSSPPNSESATPRVVGTYSSLTTFTITLSSPQNTFGFEAEPDAFSTFIFTATFYNGATVLGTATVSLSGSAGARLFAATSDTPITSVVLTTPAGANGFALAQFRYGSPGGAQPVPALGIPGMVGLTILLAAVGFWYMRRNLGHAGSLEG